MDDFYKGQRIVIREWDDMVQEFGTHYGHIDCKCNFVKDMKCFCGEAGTIIEIVGAIVKIEFDDHYLNGKGKNYSFSTDMIKEEQDVEFDINDDMLAEFLMITR